jgi:hypothetical protein
MKPKVYKKKPNGKNDTGKPTKYRPKYCKEIIAYFDREPYIIVDKTVTYANGASKEITEKEPTDLPLFGKFAHKVGVTHDTLIDWTKSYPEFGEAYKRAKQLQEHILITNGLAGGYAPAFAIFTAKNILGWRDKHEVVGEDDGPVKVEVAFADA